MSKKLRKSKTSLNGRQKRELSALLNAVYYGFSPTLPVILGKYAERVDEMKWDWQYDDSELHFWQLHHALEGAAKELTNAREVIRDMMDKDVV